MQTTGMPGSGSRKRKSQVLVIEAEPKLSQSLKKTLEGEGYAAAVATTGEEGFFLASSRPFHLVVLDLTLPGRDGLEILSALRARGFLIPVLMLTGRNAVEDRLEGLDRGADDCLMKPFALAELVARVRALLRRGRWNAEPTLGVGDLHLDPVARHASRGREELHLTPREFELLLYLVHQKGHVVSREMLLEDLWGERSRGRALDNLIDVYISRLRKKVDQGAAVKLIKTLRGVGFMVKEPPPGDGEPRPRAGRPPAGRPRPGRR